MKKKLRNINRQTTSSAKITSDGVTLKGHYTITIISIAILLGIITFMVYLPALTNNFVNWDDDRYVYQNLKIRSIDLQFLKWVSTSVVNGIWHPLTIFSYALNYSFGDNSPFGYHLTNNILHALNTSLVFILTFQLMQIINTDRLPIKFHFFIGIITSFLFGMHPLHVESVAWISERKDVLSAFFFLLSILAYLKYVSAVRYHKVALYGVCLLSFMLALLSKPMAVSLPIVLLIIDYYPLKKLFSDRQTKLLSLILEKLPFFILSIVAALVAIWSQKSEKAMLVSLPLLTRIISAIRSYIFYLAKMLWPSDLAPFYRHPVNINVSNIEYWGAAIIFVIVTYFALKKGRLYTAAWFYYVITLIPVVGLLQVGAQAAADRYTYLPSLGPFILFGLGIGTIVKKYPEKRYLSIPIMLLLSGMLVNKTISQIQIWHDSNTLWSHEISIFPDTVEIAYNNRGIYYFDSGKYQLAIEDYNKALEINSSRYADAYYNRGNAYYQLGNYQQAIVDYNSAIAIKPEYAEAYNNRGSAFLNLGEDQLALNDFNRSIELNPEYADAYNNRGSLYGRIGKHQQAIDDFIKSIEINPQDAKTYFNMGITYNGMGDIQQAIISYSKAIDLAPDNAAAYFNRGMSYAALKRFTEATRDFEEAIRLNPQYAKAYYNLGMVYSQIGNSAKANQYFEIAERLRLQTK